MHSLDPVPAARRLQTDRSDLFAVEMVGHVSANDVENLYGLLEGAYELHERIDLLMRVVDHDGVDWGDVDRDTIRSARDHASRNIGRCAIIGEPSAADAILSIISPADSQTRHFAPEDEGEAWNWLGAKPRD